MFKPGDVVRKQKGSKPILVVQRWKGCCGQELLGIYVGSKSNCRDFERNFEPYEENKMYDDEWLDEILEKGGMASPYQSSTVRECLQALKQSRSNTNQFNQESTMSQYGNQSHDQIFEALVDKQYKTIGVKLEEGGRVKAYAFRAPINMELDVNDGVVVEILRDGERSLTLGTVIRVDKDKAKIATAWVVSKVDTTANDERSAQWKTLYEGVKEAEMAKKRAVLADGYGEELAIYAPEAAEVLAGFARAPALTSDK